tara:strand:- start:1819 stop:2484 length:666 start_codon:yes stop_codon:yes gene_type:complete
MRIESKLCHLSQNKVIVQVNGWINDKNVGSALAEGATVELAEDKAISRLHKRLNTTNIVNENNNQNNDLKNINLNTEETPLTINHVSNVKLIEEPNDWSNELTAIDSELNRLNWSREDEIRFLEKEFGYNSRNKITNYNEITNYLNILKKIDTMKSSNLDNPTLNKLINESEIILKELCWDHKKGREYLQKEFKVSSRKELKENQLITFVNNLKSIRNKIL